MKESYFITAYGIARKHGFKGTEEEWLNSLTAFYMAQQAGFAGSFEDWMEMLGDPIPAFTVGEVVTLEGGTMATVEISGDKKNPVLNFGIPRGLSSEDAMPLTGGKMKGAVDMDGNKVTNLPDPEGEQDAVPKKYADEIKKKAENAQTAANNAQSAADKKVAKFNAIAALPLAGWVENTQTVEVAGVTADNTIVVGADPANYTEYADANVRCTEQGEGTLTFVCDDVPEIDLNANVMILT